MEENRRPVSSREVPFFQRFAKTLVNWGLTPNQISILSVVFAAVGGVAFSCLSTSNGFQFYILAFIAFLGIQLRLVCNLIDGLMAVEGGLKTPAGELFNDIPDRFSDWFLILGAATAIPFSWGMSWGWSAVVLAILTAYIRVLGASLQKGHDFGGPTAKQHRMFILSLGLVGAVVEKIIHGEVRYSLALAIIVITVGSLVTVFKRVTRLVAKLK
jgi:phosphatidylglycerophosphate synthase